MEFSASSGPQDCPLLTPIPAPRFAFHTGRLPAPPLRLRPVPAFSARQLVALIEEASGVALPADTLDRFQAGAPDTPVRGVAVSMMPTLDVLRRAVEAGCNLVISHEPAFYNHRDDTAALQRENDAVWAAKSRFIEENGLMLWRFHDIPHAQTPDAIREGMARELGWGDFRDAGAGDDDEALFQLPPTTLSELARAIRDTLGARALCIVGDGSQRVSGVALSPGFAGFAKGRSWLQRSEVEALVIGEDFEWETAAYVADAVAAGQQKGLIVIGHIPSEQGGMKWSAAWIESILPKEVPVRWIPTLDPFWAPEG